MDAQGLAAAIIADAQRQAARIEAETAEEGGKLETETTRILTERRATLLAQVEARYERAMRRDEAKADRDARLEVLACKRELLDTAFHAAQKNIAARRGRKREATLARLWAAANKEITVASVIAAQPDEAWLRKRTKVTRVMPGIGGFIARDLGGNVSVDLRFETMMEMIRAHDDAEIAGILFSRESSPTPGRKRNTRPKTTREPRRITHAAR